MTAVRVVRPAYPTTIPCRDGKWCDQPATLRVTAPGVTPRLRCREHALEFVAVLLATQAAEGEPLAVALSGITEEDTP